MKLCPHQIDLLKRTENFNRCAFFVDMGLGKTYIGSEKAVSFGNKILVICQKSKLEDWIEHFEKYYSLPIYDLTNEQQLKNYINNEGVGIINYDLVFRREKLLKLRNFILMLDESSLIQNENAKRSKFVLKLKPKNVILLSGTPTGGKYEKLWSQIRLLGWNITKKLFYQQYIIQNQIEVKPGLRIPLVVGYRNVDRLKQKLIEHGAVFMKSEEALKLPPMNHFPIYIKPTLEYYQFMKEDIITVHDGEELIGDNGLTKLMYARQLCSRYNPNKIIAFQDLVSSTDDRLIVFYNFNSELAILKEKIEQRPVSIVNGKIKDLTNYDNKSDSVTFIQYQAGSLGLNLQKANKIIYFSLPLSSELFEQSKKRINRIGQTKPCFYYYMLCKNTVEIKIWETLKKRKDYTDELFRKID